MAKVLVIHWRIKDLFITKWHNNLNYCIAEGEWEVVDLKTIYILIEYLTLTRDLVTKIGQYLSTNKTLIVEYHEFVVASLNIINWRRCENRANRTTNECYRCSNGETQRKRVRWEQCEKLCRCRRIKYDIWHLVWMLLCRTGECITK